MTERYIANKDIVLILEDAAERLEDEGSVEFANDASKLRLALPIVESLPESYVEPSGPEVENPDENRIPIEDRMLEHLTLAVQLSDGCDGWFNHVLTRKVRIYTGDPYLVFIHNMRDLDG